MFVKFFSAIALASSLAFGAFALADETASASDGAADNGSEFMYQTPGGKFSVTPRLSFEATAIKYNDTNSGVKDMTDTTTGFPIMVNGEYGFARLFAIGLNLGYYTSNTKTSCDSSVTNCPKNTHARGLVNPQVDLKFRNSVGTGSLRYGVAVGVPFTKTKVDTDGNSNASTDGLRLSPYVGYELPLGPGFIGGRVKYSIYGDRKTKFDGVTNERTTSGGNRIEANVFYEANVGIMTYGGAISYFSAAATDSKSGSGSATSSKNAYSGFGIQTYLPVHFTPDVTLLPTAGFEVENFTSSGAPIDAMATFSIGVGGRFTF